MKISEYFNDDFYSKFNKVIKVIDSCITCEQLLNADKMSSNFIKLAIDKFEKDHELWDCIEFENKFQVYEKEIKKKLKEKSDVLTVYKITSSETCGAKLRNKLTPYCVLLGLVKSFKEGKLSSKKFIEAVSNEYAIDNMEDLKEFSKYLDKYNYQENS